MVYQKEIHLKTARHGEMHDLTGEATKVVEEARVRTGVVQLFSVGSTTALGTVEYEPGLLQDLPATLDRLIPPSRDYGHERAWHDGNGHSHLQATLLGPSLTVPVREGRLILGTWQQIFHLECDTKPRHRSVIITVMGE
jgi:secondary thiamine-phosphate synthase enzyme